MSHLLKEGQCAAIFDTPNNCEECPCCWWNDSDSQYVCCVEKENVDPVKNKESRPSWCPLAIKWGNFLYIKEKKEEGEVE